MPAKIFVIIVLLIILYSLGSALYFFVKDRDRSDAVRTAKALTVRISLSLALFVFLLIAFATGIIKPHSIAHPLLQKQKQEVIRGR
ncbi:MAG: twin transmembrane helix small protein [Methylococcales bacterium]